jgi:hypothetical protein
MKKIMIVVFVLALVLTSVGCTNPVGPKTAKPVPTQEACVACSQNTAIATATATNVVVNVATATATQTSTSETIATATATATSTDVPAANTATATSTATVVPAPTPYTMNATLTITGVAYGTFKIFYVLDASVEVHPLTNDDAVLDVNGTWTITVSELHNSHTCLFVITTDNTTALTVGQSVVDSGGIVWTGKSFTGLSIPTNTIADATPQFWF